MGTYETSDTVRPIQVSSSEVGYRKDIGATLNRKGHSHSALRPPVYENVLGHVRTHEYTITIL